MPSSYDDAQADARVLLRKTRGKSAKERLAVMLSWAGSDLDEIQDLIGKEENPDASDGREKRTR